MSIRSKRHKVVSWPILAKHSFCVQEVRNLGGREGNYSPKTTPILPTLAGLSAEGDTKPQPELQGTQVIPLRVIK